MPDSCFMPETQNAWPTASNDSLPKPESEDMQKLARIRIREPFAIPSSAKTYESLSPIAVGVAFEFTSHSTSRISEVSNS